MATRRIASSTIFKLAITSSLILFLSSLYADKLWSSLWLIYGFIQIGLIILFAVVLVFALGFGMTKRKEYENAFVPLIIMVVFLGVILILPLNRIRNGIEFSANKELLEKAVAIVLSKYSKQTEYPTFAKLPSAFQSLSAGGGEVMVVNKLTSKGVLFFTFRGVPDGMRGFLKIKGDAAIDDLKEDLNITEAKDLGENWYYVSGD